MEDLPAEIKAFLLNHPFLQLTDDGKRVKCTLNQHDFPCNLTELQNFTKAKKYQKLSADAQFDYSQYEPHLVPSTKQPNHFFCKLTLRHINRLPHHVLRHVNGTRFKRALEKYEECMKQGVAYVPAALQKKKPRDRGSEEGERGRHAKRGSAMWVPTDSDEAGSDSEDSMSDLYPATLFSLKSPAKEDGEEEEEEEDDFQTDGDEDEKMEVEQAPAVPQKRKKVQGDGFKKKFKNHHGKRKGFKKSGKVTNGK